MSFRKRSGQKSSTGLLLLIVLLLSTACGATTTHYSPEYFAHENLDNQFIAAGTIAHAAILMQQKLYGVSGNDLANSYDVNDIAWESAIRYWATQTCSLHDQNASAMEIEKIMFTCPARDTNGVSLVDPGEVHCDASDSTCMATTAGNLQCVEFVTGLFGSLGDFALPAAGNGSDFWGLYQNQLGWVEVSPAAIAAANGNYTPQSVPLPGDMVGFNDDTNPYGHIAIVVAIYPPQGENDGSIVVAGANQTGNMSTQELAQLGARRGNFEKIVWHTQQYLSAHTNADMFAADNWQHDAQKPNLHVQGFIRRVSYYLPGSTGPFIVAPSLTGSYPGCTNNQASTDPYQDPLLKKLLAQAMFQSPDMHTLVNEAWCIAVRSGLPPQYFILQIDDESGFDAQDAWIHARGLIQITPDDLYLVGNDGENGSVHTPNCIFDTSAAPDCMNTASDLPPVTLANLVGKENVLHNLEVGARSMLDKLIYNLAPIGQQMDELSDTLQRSGQALVPLNAKVQKCVSINYSFTQNPDCLQGLARAMVSYNGGQSVVDGYKHFGGNNINNNCKPFFTTTPDPQQWLRCVWDNQEHRDPHDSNDGNHPDNGQGEHEGARYIVNIFDFLPNHLAYCEGDETAWNAQQACLDDVNKYPQIL